MAPSFSSYLTRLISALASVEAMLPRIKPNSSLPSTITRLAYTGGGKGKNEARNEKKRKKRIVKNGKEVEERISRMREEKGNKGKGRKGKRSE